MTESIVKIHSLSFKYKNQSELALTNINLNIPTNSCTVVLGPNGAGKSTLLSLISGLIEESKDSATKAIEFPSFTETERFVSYCTQQCALYNELSIEENLTFFASLLRPDKKPHQEVAELIEIFDLKKYSEQRISHCSGGIRQRAHVAVSLMYAYPLIVLDEPFNNIDPESREVISVTLKKYLKEKNVSLIISSHQFEAIEDLWTHLVFIKNGQVADFITRSNTDTPRKLQMIFEELQ